MRTTWIACLLVTGVLCGLPSWGEAEVLTIPGTGACESVLRSIAVSYERANPMAKVVIPSSIHSEGGIRQVAAGNAVIARVSRPLTPEESEKGLVQEVFARDAIVFAVGVGVRPQALKIQQLADIFSGKIRTWNELGAGNGSIRVLYRQTGDSNLTRLQASFKEFRNLRYTREGKALYYDHEMIEMLRKYGNSIGFITLSTLRESGSPLTCLSVDGIAPTPENFASGRYPLLTEYSIVHRKGPLPPEAREFLEFLRGSEGSRLLSGHGLVPVGR